mmetsp:Transcript_54129/g.150579  ORF Transcript_54129/g.150579 Transcript_54129/m.150579 type:complete len:369 (-) Transcript_54129:33-1139(-)
MQAVVSTDTHQKDAELRATKPAAWCATIVVAILNVLAYVVSWAASFYAQFSSEDEPAGGQWPSWAIVWYPAMCVVATLNIVAYILVIVVLGADPAEEDRAVRAYKRRMLVLAAPYVLVCAWRTYFPNQYESRHVWWDTPLSSILLARTMATIAELSWIAQLASALAFCSDQVHRETHRTSTSNGCSWNAYAQVSARLMFIFICVAECCSFAATISLSNLWFAIEESLWGLAYLITWPAFVHLLYAAQGSRQDQRCCVGRGYVGLYALLASIFCFFYVPWVAILDVPPYWEAYQQQLREGFSFLPFWEGVKDALVKRVVTHSWEAWGPLLSNMIWRATYFGPNVWASILLAFAPRLSMDSGKALTPEQV